MSNNLRGLQYIEKMHPGGWRRVYNYDSIWRRILEAWWVLSGKHSLHAAWQSGYDYNGREKMWQEKPVP
jgi:hypothetical protein